MPVWDVQSPVVKVLTTSEPLLPITISVMTFSMKIPKLRPNALGLRLKYPADGG